MGDDAAAASLTDSLILASKSGYADDLAELSNLDVDINHADPLGNRALHYSSGGGHIDAVYCLLAHPAIDINATNKMGDTALHKAASRNHLNVAKTLVGAGADTSIRNADGKRAVDLVHGTNVELGALLRPVVAGPDYDDEEEEDVFSDEGDEVSSDDDDL